jgi:hypothetical protein
LLGLDPCLLLPESVQFGLPLSNLLAILANIWDPCIGVFVPDIKQRNQDIPSQIMKGLLPKARQLPFVVLPLLIVQLILSELEQIVLTAFGIFLPLHLFSVLLQLFLLQTLFATLVKFVAVLVELVLYHVARARIGRRTEKIVVGVEVIATLERIGMDESELLVEDHASTALLADVLVAVLGFHMFSTEDALFELEVDAVLAQDLGIELALDLLDKFIDGVAKDKVSFQGRVSMQVQVHKHPLLFTVVLTEFLHRKTRRLPVWIGIGVVPV